VTVVEERQPVVGAERLVDALAVDEPVVVDRHHRLPGRRDPPIDVYGTAHISRSVA
jgi:hypothetical protein